MDEWWLAGWKAGRLFDTAPHNTNTHTTVQKLSAAAATAKSSVALFAAHYAKVQNPMFTHTCLHIHTVMYGFSGMSRTF